MTDVLISHAEEEQLAADDQSPLRRKRSTELGVTFDSGMADGWAFGVPAVFREAMDIRLLRYVDKEKTKALRTEKGSTNDVGHLRTVFKSLWTLGVPPARSFNTGDIFYRPAHIRNLEWKNALAELTHCVRVRAAQPDRLEDGLGGWVEFELDRYSNGLLVERAVFTASQGDFEQFLRTGSESDLSRADGTT